MFNVTGLLPETVYGIRVRGLNTVGYGNWSHSITMATANATVPSVPGAVVLSHTSRYIIPPFSLMSCHVMCLVLCCSRTSLSVQWTPSEDLGLTIDSYILQL
jgi:hypothetical protein